MELTHGRTVSVMVTSVNNESAAMNYVEAKENSGPRLLICKQVSITDLGTKTVFAT